jgi:hypothetical protein
MQPHCVRRHLQSPLRRSPDPDMAVKPTYSCTNDDVRRVQWIGSDDMAKLVFGLNQSLDGYIDHQKFAPGPALFHHFIEQVHGLIGSVYGRRMYEVMRVWDEDHPKWTPELRDFARAWRSQPKWVVSRSLKSVGPNRLSSGPN